MNEMLVILADILKVTIPLIGVVVVTWRKIWGPQFLGSASKGRSALSDIPGGKQDTVLSDERENVLERHHWEALSKVVFPAWGRVIFGVMALLSILFMALGVWFGKDGVVFLGAAYFVASFVVWIMLSYNITNLRMGYITRNAPPLSHAGPLINARVRIRREGLLHKKACKTLKAARRSRKRGKVSESEHFLLGISVACVAVDERGIIVVRQERSEGWGIPIGRPVHDDESLQSAASRVFKESFGVELRHVQEDPVGCQVIDQRAARQCIIVGFALDADGISADNFDKLPAGKEVKFLSPVSTDLAPAEADFACVAKEAREWKISRAAAS